MFKRDLFNADHDAFRDMVRRFIAKEITPFGQRRGHRLARHDRAKGVTLFLVDTHLPGFRRGKNLRKIGMKGQDTSELFFDDLRVPASAMLGEEGKGFELMMTKLAQG